METKKKSLTSAVDVLQSLFEKGSSPLAGQYVRWQVEKNWLQVAGETIAANSRPANFIKGTLYLGVVHPAWIQQLRFMESEILNNVNDFVGKPWAKQLKFFVDGKARQYPPAAKKSFGSE